MNPPAPPPQPTPASPISPSAPDGHPAFTYRKTWRWFAAELQWGLIFGALLGFAASLLLTVAFTWWNAETNRFVQQIIPGWPGKEGNNSVAGLGPVGYIVSLVLLGVGFAWGVFWRRRFRRDFQQRFRL